MSKDRTLTRAERAILADAMAIIMIASRPESMAKRRSDYLAKVEAAKAETDRVLAKAENLRKRVDAKMNEAEALLKVAQARSDGLRAQIGMLKENDASHLRSISCRVQSVQ